MPVDNLSVNILNISTGIEGETYYELITISNYCVPFLWINLKLDPKSLFRYIADCRQEISAHYKPRFVSC